MRNSMKWFQGGLGVAIVAVLVTGVLFVLRNRPAPISSVQVNPSPAEQTPAPTQVANSPLPPPTPRIVVITPLPSPPPFPTPLPTPVVTRVPAALPPFVAVPTGEAGQPYTVYIRDDNLVKAIDSTGKVERTVIDVHTQTSLFLGRRETWTTVWGAISPDGQQLALVLTDFERIQDLGQRGAPGSREPHYYIYLLDLATGELRLLVENAMKPVWSPDGTRLAFYNTKTRGLGVIDLATGATEEIFAVEPESEHQADWFTWSPDSKRMAVVKTWGGIANAGGIWAVEIAKGAESHQIIDMEMNAAVLSWSPDGVEILFLSDRGNRSTPERPTNIWSVYTETGNQQQLTHDISASAGAPLWSPDGKWIAFAGTNLLEGEDYQHDLWLLASDGSTLKRLTDDPVNDLNPTWASSGTKLVYNKTDQGLWELDLLSGSVRQLVKQITSYWFLR